MFSPATESANPQFKAVDAYADKVPPEGAPTLSSKVKIKRMVEATIMTATSPKLRAFEHSVWLATFILLVNFVTTGSLLYYYKTQCTDSFALVDNTGWVTTNLTALQTLRDGEGVTIKEQYSMGYSTSSTSVFSCSTTSAATASTCYDSWDTEFLSCSDDCSGSNTVSLWYETCTTWATAISNAVSYAAYVDLVVTLVVIVVYGCCTGQLRSSSGREKMMSVVISEAAEAGIGKGSEKVESRKAVMLVDEEDGSLHEDVNRTLQLMENDRQRMQLQMDQDRSRMQQQMDQDRLKMELQLLDLRKELKLLRPGPFDGRDHC